jgi:flavin reductase (NADH)
MTVIDLPALALAPMVAEQGYRDLMRVFPTGVAVVTTIDAEGRPRGMTCSSLTSISVAGRVLAVGLTSTGTTCHAVRWNGAFAVNLLHVQGEGAARLFSTKNEDRFSQIAWDRSPATGLPWLTEHAFATAECRVAGLFEIGDHTLVVGEVIGVQQTVGTPLLYGDRGYAAWPGGTVAPPSPSGAPDPEPTPNAHPGAANAAVAVEPEAAA